MAEYIGPAVDIGAYFFFSHMERRLKANLYDIRDNVPTFVSHAQLKNKLKVIFRRNMEARAWFRVSLPV